MQTIKLTESNKDQIIEQTIKTLKSGGLTVFPSDTVYGLLADAKDEKAINRLLEFKERQPNKAISVFVADKAMAEDYVKLNQNGLNVVNNLLPGPFTVVAESKHKTCLQLEAENGTLGIRIPDNQLIATLLAQYNNPITATSANLSGKPSCYSISALLKTLSKKKKNLLNLVIDAGNLPKNKPSTVIDTTTGQLKTLRAGDLLPETPNSLVSNSEAETRKLARFLVTKFIKKNLSRPIVFLLEGDLGTGKTIFAKGLGKELGIKEEIISPTFNICNEYLINIAINTTLPLNTSDINNLNQKISKVNKTKFIHCDFYRVEAKEEFIELGFPEFVSCGNIYAFEWSERLPAEMISALKTSAEIVFIKIKHHGIGKRIIEWGKN